MGNRELFVEKSPKELLVEFQTTGANAPFEEIMRRYGAMVYGVCLRVTGDKHDAEDATQAVFLSLALQAKTSREITYVGPWLQKVAHRLALDVKKSKTRRKRREEKLAEQTRHANGISVNGNGNGRYRGQTEGAMGGGAFGGGNGHLNNPADAPGAQELKTIMMEELNQLPAKYRMPLVMHYFGGLSREEMSEQLKCNPSTLGVRVHRGKAMLGTRLAKRGIAISAIAMTVLLEHVIRDSATMPLIGTASAAGNGFVAGSNIGVMVATAKVSHLIRTAARAAWFAKTRYGVVAMLVIGWAAVASGSAGAVVQQIRNHLPTLDLKSWITPLFKSLVPAPRADAGDVELARTSSEEPKVNVDLDRVLGAPPSELALAARHDALIAIPPAAKQATPVVVGHDDPHLNDLARAIMEPPSLLPTFTKPQTSDAKENTIGSEIEEVAIAAIPTESRPTNFYIGASGGGGIGGKPEVYTLPAGGSLHTLDQIIGDRGFGIFRQEGGVNRVDGTLTLGNQKGSVGRYELLGGTVDAKQEVIGNEGSATFIQMNGVNRVQNSITVGASGDGTVDHRGGRTTVANTGADGGIAMAVNPGSKANFNLSGGDVWATPQNIGVAGDAVVVQTDGTNHTNTIVLANENGSSGIYKLDGGQIRLEPNDLIAAASSTSVQSAFYDSASVPMTVASDPASLVKIGGKGDALFSLGTPSSTGQIIENNSKASFVIRGRPSATGSLVGWGVVDATGTLTNNGQVGADGHRQQRTLDLTHFSSVTNTIENPAEGGTSGWFARRKGELALPGVHVTGGDGTYTWGEDPLDPVIDLVNSVRFGIDNAEHGGDVFMSLLSPLRDDIPTLPADHKFIGVWKFDASRIGNYDGVDLQVRYDDAMAADLGLSESLLKLWRYDDAVGQWQRINDDSFYRDTVLHLISGHAAGSVDYFAVSAPEPGVSVLAVVGAAALLKRRRRRDRR